MISIRPAFCTFIPQIPTFMSLFGESHQEKQDEKIIDKLLRNESDLIRLVERQEVNIGKLVGVVDKLTQHPVQNRPIFTLSININNQIYLMANVALVIGSPKTGLFTLIDNKTLLPITPVTYSNQSLGTNSNPEFATFALAQTDPNDPTSLNSVVGTPVAPGTGTLVINTAANYTDPGDGSAQSGTFSVTKTFVVQASADGASFDVVFP